MKERLKKCPFCGGAAAVECEDPDYGYSFAIYWVECSYCEATGTRSEARGYKDTEEHRAEQQAVEEWNARVCACE